MHAHHDDDAVTRPVVPDNVRRAVPDDAHDTHNHAPDIIIAGLGDTGLACVRYLQAQGLAVAVTDSRTHPPRLNELQNEFPHVPLCTSDLHAEWLCHARTIVLSPGLDPYLPVLQKAREAGVDIIGDITLFARAYQKVKNHARAPSLLAITGSNGKSTVTKMCGALCQAAGLQTAVGGNLGPPALSLLDNAHNTDVYILELSSFQLQSCSRLPARAAVVLNISPDHRDRHLHIADYADIKGRVYRDTEVCIINRDDALAAQLSGQDGPSFGSDAPPRDNDYGILPRHGEAYLARGTSLLMGVRQLSLPGAHNVQNALAAMALAEAAGVDSAQMPATLSSFRGLPHRYERIACVDGVWWVNDSKATNVGATCAALADKACVSSDANAPANDESRAQKSIVLLAGGDSKGADFTPLARVAARAVRQAIVFGRDAGVLTDALHAAVPVMRVATLTQAVQKAREVAQPGDVVLLSPACASFDQFEDYRARGDCFRQLVLGTRHEARSAASQTSSRKPSRHKNQTRGHG